jgi:hypothetical protein
VALGCACDNAANAVHETRTIRHSAAHELCKRLGRIEFDVLAHGARRAEINPMRAQANVEVFAVAACRDHKHGLAAAQRRLDVLRDRVKEECIGVVELDSMARPANFTPIRERRRSVVGCFPEQCRRLRDAAVFAPGHAAWRLSVSRRGTNATIHTMRSVTAQGNAVNRQTGYGMRPVFVDRLTRALARRRGRRRARPLLYRACRRG